MGMHTADSDTRRPAHLGPTSILKSTSSLKLTNVLKSCAIQEIKLLSSRMRVIVLRLLCLRRSLYSKAIRVTMQELECLRTPLRGERRDAPPTIDYVVITPNDTKYLLVVLICGGPTGESESIICVWTKMRCPSTCQVNL